VRHERRPHPPEARLERPRPVRAHAGFPAREQVSAALTAKNPRRTPPQAQTTIGSPPGASCQRIVVTSGRWLTAGGTPLPHAMTRGHQQLGAGESDREGASLPHRCWVDGTSGSPALVGSRGLQTEEEGDGALRMVSGREDRPLVISEDFEPRRQVAGMVGPGLELRRDAEIGHRGSSSRVRRSVLHAPARSELWHGG